jgi:N-acyl-phosphatidylethanolamine-hydrolysing phospholipase D
MWSARASPIPWAGPKRLARPGVPIDALPPIDLVLLSHNHYDHLDVPTVRSLASRHPGAQWVTPLGLSDFVRRHGVRVARELDWWEVTAVDSAVIGCTPAQHFSARGLGDRGDTLWCGWTVAVEGRKVYFAGDTAYHPEFGRIGAVFGPFDLALLPIGAYEPRWFMRSVHMNAEEAVQAFREVSAAQPGHAARRVMVGGHWGTFRLTDEAVEEPPVRAREAWTAAGLPPDDLWVLAHGETRAF